MKNPGPILAVAIAVALVLLALVFVRTAWINDDAYITLRTVDNFVNGHGLTWNTDERVQAYTHPLWMFILSSLYVFTREAYFTTIVLSIFLSVLAVCAFVLGVARTRAAAVLGLVVLLFSKAFVDYSTGGLESPLTHLLIALFLAVYFRSSSGLKGLFTLSLIASLALLTRMDVGLLLFPALVYRFLQLPKGRALWVVALGLSPFVAWEIFSIFYYGFPLPNTAYAKLNTGIHRSELIAQGVHYALYSLRHDPVTLMAVCAGAVMPFVTRSRRRMPVAVGIALYTLYVVWIGGDFMGGRFFTPVLFASVCVLSRHTMRREIRWVYATAVTVLIGIVVWPPPLASGSDFGSSETAMYRGISDARSWHFQSTGLFREGGAKGVEDHPKAVQGRGLREQGPTSKVTGMVGIVGFYAGPNARIFDVYGLCDPLLARLPARDLSWRIGHWARGVPGFMNTWLGTRGGVEDERIITLYDKVRLITRGELDDPDRLLEIWKMNTGAYRGLVAPFFEAKRLQHTALRHVEDDRPAEAIEVAKKAVELDPYQSAALAVMSRAYLQLGDLPEARAAALEALALRRGVYEPDAMAVAEAYEASGDIDASIEVLESLLRVSARHFDALVAVGAAYDKTGQWRQAVGVYQRALRLKPDDTDLEERLSTARRGGQPLQ